MESRKELIFSASTFIDRWQPIAKHRFGAADNFLIRKAGKQEDYFLL